MKFQKRTEHMYGVPKLVAKPVNVDILSGYKRIHTIVWGESRYKLI
jgi:hypothetical protein